jgi:hypothetical protein
MPFPGLLRREDDDRIARLSALLRLAEYLERSRTQVVQEIRCQIHSRAVTVECVVRGDASTELWATERKADLFQQAFNRRILFRTRRVLGPVLPSRPVSKVSAPGPLWQRMREVMGLFGTE